MKTFKPRLRRQLTAVGVLVALMTGLGFAGPVMAATGTIGAMILTQVTGTGPWDADDAPGNDSSGTNNIVRTNDTVQYNVEISYSGTFMDAHILIDLPKGEQVVSMPPYCIGGSSVAPTLADPGANLTSTSWTNLKQQTLDCALGDITATGVTTYPLYAKVRPEVPHGEMLKPVSAEFVSSTASKISNSVTHKISATARFDMQYGITTGTNTGYIWGPNTTPCVGYDPTGCFETKSLVANISVPKDGKGSTPLQNGFTFTIDLSAKGVYGSQITSTPKWIAAGTDAQAEAKYRPRIADKFAGCLTYGNTGHGPYGRMTGNSKATPDNAVIDSGTTVCTMNQTTGIMTVKVSGGNTTAWTSPITGSRGGALPSDRAYVFSKEFDLETPIQTVKDLGTLTSSPGGGKVWTLPQTVSFGEVRGKTIGGQTVADTSFTKSFNNYKTTSLVAKNEGASDAFWTGVPGTPGNTAASDFSPGWAQWEGLPGQGSRFSGDGVLLEDQVGLVSSITSFQALDPGLGQPSCNSWDNTALALAAGDYDGGQQTSNKIPSDGDPIWVQGGYDALYEDVLGTVAVQYGYTATKSGTGPLSTCNNSDSDVGWTSNPNDARFNNDPTLAADGTYTGINKARFLYTTPVANRSVITVSMALRNLGNRSVGSTLPFYNSVKPSDFYGTLAAAVADARPWAESSYTTGPKSADPQIGGGGGRAIAGVANASIVAEVQEADLSWSSGTPSYVGGADIPVKLTPGVSAAVTTNKSYTTTMEACLPEGVNYKAGSASVAPASATLVPAGKTGATVTCLPDETYLLWNLGRKVPNAVIPPVTFTAAVNQTLTGGTFTINSGIQIPGVIKTASAQFSIASPLGIKISRTAVQSALEVNPSLTMASPRTMSWDTEFLNTNPGSTPTSVTLIEVLPRNGYAGSSFSGTSKLTGVSITSGTGISLEYTTAANLTVDNAGNTSAATWTTVTPTTPAGWAAVTGVKILRPGNFLTTDRMKIRFTATPLGNKDGDIYVGRVVGKAGGMASGTLPLQTSVQVVGSSIGDRVWVDLNKDGLQTTGEKGLANQAVTLTGTDSKANVVGPINTTTDANGAYTFNNLASGSYVVDFDKAGLNAKFLAVTKRLMNKGTGDSAADSAAKVSVSLKAADDRKDVDLGVTGTAILTLTTTANPANLAYISPKDTVTFTMTMKNTGQQPFTTAKAVETLSPEFTIVAGSIVPSVGSASATASSTATTVNWTGPLAVGATATVTFKVTVDKDTEDDTNVTSRIKGTGTWFGGDQPSDCDPANAPASCKTLHHSVWPHIAVTTAVARSVSDGTNLTNLGEKLTYTAAMKNVGKVNVINKTGALQVPVGNDLTPTNGPVTPLNFGSAATALLPAATVNAATVAYTVDQDDVDWGNVSATSDAAATTAAGYGTNAETDVTDQAVAQTRSLALRSSVTDDNADGTAQVGEELIYRFSVVNTGVVSIENLSIADTFLKGKKVSITPEYTFDGRLSPAEAVTYISKPYAVQTADKTVGSITVNATAAGLDRRKIYVKSLADETIIDTPSASGLDLVKRVVDTASPGGTVTNVADGFADSGDKLVYTFTVTNNSEVDMHGLAITDPMLTAASASINAPANFDGVLAPRESVTYTSSQYAVTAANLTAGTVKNTATAKALDSLRNTVTSNDSSASMPTATTPVIVKTGSGAGPAEAVGLVPTGKAGLQAAAGGLLGAAALCMLFLALYRRRKSL